MYLQGLKNDDCSLTVVCGELELPIITTDTFGDACSINIHSGSTMLSPSKSANVEDCSCPNNLELSSKCLGNTAQPAAMGEYSPVCSNIDGSNVYMHVNPISNIYIYHDNKTSVCCVKYYHVFTINCFIFKENCIV